MATIRAVLLSWPPVMIAFGIRDDRAVVEEDVHVIPGGQQCADVALQHEVGLHLPFDRLLDLQIGGVDELADLVADGLLPVGQRVDVLVDARGHTARRS